MLVLKLCLFLNGERRSTEQSNSGGKINKLKTGFFFLLAIKKNLTSLLWFFYLFFFNSHFSRALIEPQTQKKKSWHKKKCMCVYIVFTLLLWWGLYYILCEFIILCIHIIKTWVSVKIYSYTSNLVYLKKKSWKSRDLSFSFVGNYIHVN